MKNSTDRPLDQQSADKDKGNCFPSALEFIKDLPHLPKTYEKAELVHGTYRSDSVPHAWVEVDGQVFDYSASEFKGGASNSYYERLNAKPLRRFSREQADAILQSQKRKCNSYDLNWIELTEEELSQCEDLYDPKTSPFTLDEKFSDPSPSDTPDKTN